MKRMSPICSGTILSPYGHEWRLKNFDDYLKELSHIIDSCSGNDSLLVFRGHAEYTWLLDSTLVRNSIQYFFGLKNYQSLNPEIRESLYFHKFILSTLLLKFGVISKPSRELFDRENEGLDPWFEFMKHCQQYPENDKYSLKGTPIIDWTTDANVALYFANENRKGQGAIWICDASATGKILQVKKVREILDLMNEPSFFESPKGVPLMFHPQKQTAQQRAIRQKAIYFAQMDFRYDLAEIWSSQDKDKSVFVKLILPDGTQEECKHYLNSQYPPITQEYLFPN